MKNEIAPLLVRFFGKRVPVILQTEVAECGLACICMIASYWGHKIDLVNIRRRHSISLKGMGLKSLMEIARALLLQSRALRVDTGDLYAIKMPCVLHWDMNHFVILKSVKRNRFEIIDPAVGERMLRIEDFDKHFTGVALEVFPSADFKKKREVRNFSFFSLTGHVIGLKTALLQLMVLGLVLQAFSLISPFYMQWLIDEALISGDRDLVQVLGIGFLLLGVVQTSVSAVRSWITAALSTNFNFQWLGNAFGHLLKLPVEFFEKRHIGDIVSKFGSIQLMQRSITIQFVEGVIDGVLVFGAAIMMLLYSPMLAVLVSTSLMMYVMVRLFVFGILKNATAEQIILAAKQNTYFMETVRGIQSVRLFGKIDERRSGWMNSLADQFNADVRIFKISISYQAANSLIFSCERVIIIWLAALAVLDNKFSIGMLFAFISYRDQFSERMVSLIDKVFELKILRIHGERVADIVLSEAQEDLPFGDLDMKEVLPSVELCNISFRYSDTEPYVVRDLNLLIPSGQSVAITGTSGCGKTTLLKLILGLMEPSSGHVLIGGVKLEKIQRTHLRRMFGTVMQDDTLFSGSIADNISFFDAYADQERIMSCAHFSAVHEEIVAMPMGYSTLVGDIGTGISGGQKQRILLARALYVNPRILVLDEATSHLDIGNETSVNDVIKKFELTRIIVAHRPETIRSAQRVIVMEKGQIVRDQCQGISPFESH